MGGIKETEHTEIRSLIHSRVNIDTSWLQIKSTLTGRYPKIKIRFLNSCVLLDRLNTQALSYSMVWREREDKGCLPYLSPLLEWRILGILWSFGPSPGSHTSGGWVSQSASLTGATFEWGKGPFGQRLETSYSSSSILHLNIHIHI